MKEKLGQDKSEFNVLFVHSDLDDAGLTPQEFRVYAHLARRSNAGQAWPGIDSMAEVCRMNKSTVIESIRALETSGMLRVTRKHAKSNLYILTRRSSWVIPDLSPVGSVLGNAPNEGTSGVGIRERKVIHRRKSSSLSRPETESEVVHFCTKLGLPESDAEYFWSHWQSNGFTNNKKPMKDWEHTIRSWKLAGHCPSQKGNNRNGPDKRTGRESSRNVGTANEGKHAQYRNPKITRILPDIE